MGVLKKKNYLFWKSAVILPYTLLYTIYEYDMRESLVIINTMIKSTFAYVVSNSHRKKNRF